MISVMKKTWRYLICGIALLAVGCTQHDALMFEDKARVCFARGENGSGQQDSILQSFFVVPESQDRDTVWVEIALMGFPTDQDRPIKIVQTNRDAADAAIAGTHYLGFDDTEIKDLIAMGANQVTARIPVIFLRDLSLKTERKRLEMTIEENDYFKRAIDADCDFMLQTTELAEMPESWNSAWRTYFGEWSSQKMWFIVNYLGLDDFEAEYDSGYKKYLKQKAHSKLYEYNSTHDERLCNDLNKHHENGKQCENCVVFP